LPAADLFANGGKLDADTDVEGCELVTAAQGVRFTVLPSCTTTPVVNITATIKARPNVALVCRELALALLQGVRVSQPSPIGFRDMGG